MRIWTNEDDDDLHLLFRSTGDVGKVCKGLANGEHFVVGGRRDDRAKIKVFLDGEEITDVDIADEEQGLVRVALRDAEGNFVIDYGARASEIHIARAYRLGKVEIVIPNEIHIAYQARGPKTTVGAYRASADASEDPWHRWWEKAPA